MPHSKQITSTKLPCVNANINMCHSLLTTSYYHYLVLVVLGILVIMADTDTTLANFATRAAIANAKKQSESLKSKKKNGGGAW
jgi:hypothetical protein